MNIFIAMDPSKILARLDGREARMHEAIGRWHFLAGDAVLREAQRLIPVKTGKTRASLYADVTGSVVRVGSRSRVAAYINNGTRAHTIRPIGGRGALSFQMGGRKVFAKVIHHPGTKGTHFLQRALERKKDFVIALLRQYTLQESRLLD